MAVDILPTQATPCVAARADSLRPDCLAAVATEAENVRQRQAAVAADRIANPAEYGVGYEEYIYLMATEYGVDASWMMRVMYCESGGDRYADNGVCKGLFQFNPGTWASTPEGAAGASIYDGYAQIRMTAWMLTQGRSSEWVCQ